MRISIEKIRLIIADIFLLIASLLFSYLIRYDFSLTQDHIDQFLHILPIFVLLEIIFLAGFSVYKGIWRYSGASDLLLIIKATVSYTFLLALGQILLRTYLVSPRLQELIHPLIGTITYVVFIGFDPKQLEIPYAIFIINLLGSTLFIAGERLGARLWVELRRKEQSLSMKRLLIVGTGDESEVTLRELRRNPNLPYYPVGLIDDNVARKGLQIHGVKVIGTVEEIPSIVKRENVEEILIALPPHSGSQIRRIISLCDQLKVHFRTFPSISNVIEGKIPIKQFPEIHMEDLLGRKETKINLEEISSYISQHTILVTGAGGSIGSELCSQISRFKPKELILLGAGENSLFEIYNSLKWEYPPLKQSLVLANIQDQRKIQQVFEKYRPDIVFHTAAHKHVPIMEMYPEEAIKNNIIGTKNVVDSCHAIGVLKMINISTDKAVNPTSVMGVSKRIAELYIQGFSKQSSTLFITVRFGNVLGSRGSVAPIFQRQIARGGPLTITDPSVTRYFMTIPEAVKLVIQTGAMGQQGDIFVLDMGEPINIYEFAKQLIVLSGYKPQEDISIEFIGLRPGEKLYEELHFKSEDVTISEHRSIFVAKHQDIDFKKLSKDITELEAIAREGNRTEIFKKFKEIVPTYQHEST